MLQSSPLKSARGNHSMWRCLLATAVLSAALPWASACQSASDSKSPRVVVSFESTSSNRDAGSWQPIRAWYSASHRDSIRVVVRVEPRARRSANGSAVFAEVRLRGGEMRADQQVPDIMDFAATDAAATWLPAVARTEALVSSGTRGPQVSIVVRPDSLVAAIRKVLPEFFGTRLGVRACVVTTEPGAGKLRTSCADAELQLRFSP